MKISFKLAALAALGGALYARLIEPRRLEIVEMPVFIHTLAPAFDGYRIVQFSDIHVDGEWTTRERLIEVVQAINALDADLIAFTGDLVTNQKSIPIDDLVVPLRDLRARDGVVAVAGNHDSHMYAGLIEYIMNESGMIYLDNRVHTIQRAEDCLHIGGVGSMLKQKARLDLVLSQLQDESPAILLAHEPDFADISAATGRFALQLSGHSHGGQVRLPIVTRLVLPSHSRRNIRGVRQVKTMMQYTNRGIGMVSLPVRFNCPPEITVFTLRAAQY